MIVKKLEDFRVVKHKSDGNIYIHVDKATSEIQFRKTV